MAPTLKQYSAGQGSVTADNLNAFVQTCQNFAALRNLTGVTGMLVTAQGQSTSDDGLGTTFYWNSTSIAADDNLTVVAPYGSTQGRWVQLVVQFSLTVASLPLALPATAGLLWNNGGVVSISSSSGYPSPILAAGSITLANMAPLAANSIIGNNTGSIATPLALTGAQTTALLSAFIGDTGTGGTKGLVPAPTAGQAAANFFLGAGGAWVSSSSALSVGNSGSTNNSSSGSGAFVNHTPSYTAPANFLTSGRAIRVIVAFHITTGTAPSTLQIALRAGTTTLSTITPVAPAASVTNNSFTLSWIVQAIAAPGATANVETSPFGAQNSFTSANTMNVTAQPVALATNGALVLQISSEWTAAGTGTNTLTLSQFIVEDIN